MSSSTTSVTFPTVEEYRAADVAGKAALRKSVDVILRDAVRDGDLPTAQSAMSLLSEFTTKSTPDKVEVDWSQIVADRVATLRRAADLLESGEVDITGAPEDWASSNESGDGIDLPEGTVDEEAATKLASAKVTRSTSRADIGAGIEQAFEGLESGEFLTVQQITNKAGLPSAGAVAARLFPKSGTCTVEGIVPVEATADHPKGATKA